MPKKPFSLIKQQLKKCFIEQSWNMAHDYNIYRMVLNFIQKNFYKASRNKCDKKEVKAIKKRYGDKINKGKAKIRPNK